MVTVVYSVVVHNILHLYGLFGFWTVPLNHLRGLFANVMKERAALILCIVYFAPKIRHLWWHPGPFHICQQHHYHCHHNYQNKKLNHLIFTRLFLKTLVIITKYTTHIKNIQILWLNNHFWTFIAPAPQKRSVAQTIQYCWSFSTSCIKWSWFIFSWCGITCHT